MCQRSPHQRRAQYRRSCARAARPPRRAHRMCARCPCRWLELTCRFAQTLVAPYISLTYTAYAVVGFGEAKPPQDLLFRAGCGGFAAAASVGNKGGGRAVSPPHLLRMSRLRNLCPLLLPHRTAGLLWFATGAP